MNQLDEHTRRALCAADQPPPGVEDRVLAAILGPVGGPGPDGGGMSSAPGSGGLGSATLVHAVKIVGATIGLAAGGMALLAITAAGVRALPESKPQQVSARAEAPVEVHEQASPGWHGSTDGREAAGGGGGDAREQVAAVVAGEQLPEAERLAEAEPLAEPEAAPAVRPVPTQRPSKSPVEREPDTTIEAELALMKTARSSDDHERALAALDRHRREFATGVFAAEREVLRVEHLCALGRADEARTVAAAFIARHPANPLRSRVDSACPN